LLGCFPAARLKGTLDLMKTFASMALSVLSALVVTASAADFRALDFGAPCANVRASEEKLGSTFHSAYPASGIYIFIGTHLGRAVEISYQCWSGVFKQGTYIFVLPRRDATELYAQLRSVLVLEMGEPTHDFDSQRFREEMQARGIPFSGDNEYTCIWEAQRRRVHLNSSGPRNGENWKTAVSYEQKE
jgi:hypothetical protein